MTDLAPAPAPTHRVGYRPELDGLRTVAVMLVVAFHAGIGWMEGGFIGVDVFFVLSGFLITGLLVDDHAKGSFSLTSFYARRSRRLLPAATLVIVAISVAWLFTASVIERAPLATRCHVGGAVLQQLALRVHVHRLLRRGQRTQPVPALLVAVGGGAVLLRLAGGRRAGVLGEPTATSPRR